jgi:hypothetical protein
MAAITKNRKFGKKSLKIIFSETTEPIGPKLWWNGLQMVFFENFSILSNGGHLGWRAGRRTQF